jgi:3D (Asp-Asp-Asp) domain-containing protein
MFITRSFWRKVVATVGAAVGFVFVYETTIRDSRYAARQAMAAEAAASPQAGSMLQFTATAYCKGETTASGVSVRTGIAAADPALLPVGTVVRIDTPEPRYDGIWTVMDTGPAVQGRIIDLYLWSCHDALKFGRRPIKLTVLRLGWNPENSGPAYADALFKQRELNRGLTPLRSRPIDSRAPMTVPVLPAVNPAPMREGPTPPQDPPPSTFFLL